MWENLFYKHQTNCVSELVHHFHTHGLMINGANGFSKHHHDLCSRWWAWLIFNLDLRTAIRHISRETNNSPKTGVAHFHAH